MIHTLIQTQPRPRATELTSIPPTLHRTLPLIHDLGIAHKPIPTVALPPVLRAKVMPALARARAALHRHGITRRDRGGKDAAVRAVRVAALVAVPPNSGVAGDGDGGVVAEHGHAVCGAAGLGARAGAGRFALGVRPRLVRGGEHPRAVAFVGVLEPEVRVPAAEGGAGGVGGIGGGGHARAEGPRVEGVGDAAGISVAGERWFAGWGWQGGCGCWRRVLVLVDVDAL
jgi:hypothetical protein